MIGVSKTKYVIMVEYFNGEYDEYTITSNNPKKYESFIEYAKGFFDVAFIWSYTIDSTGEKSEARKIYLAY